MGVINKVLFTLLNLDLLLLLTAMILILMYMVVIHMRGDLENPFEIKVPPFLDKYVYYVLIFVYLVLYFYLYINNVCVICICIVMWTLNTFSHVDFKHL